MLRAAHLSENFEPQRKFDFQIDFGDDVLRLSVSKTTLPTETNEEIELAYGNEKVWIAGQTTYEASTLELRDTIDAGTADALMAWRRDVYDPDTGNIGRASTYKRTASLFLLASDGSTYREWQLIGCWPQSVKAGDLDMTDNNVVLIEATIRYDRAIYLG